MKKLLSIFLSVVMALTCLTTATAVFADGEKTAKVEFSVYDGGVFTMTPQFITVSENADDKYANQIGYNDQAGSVTVFDAVVAAHEVLFGEDFMTLAPITYSGGYLTQSFGETTSALSFRINGAMDDGAGNYYGYDTALTDGDSVEYMFYQNGYNDKYTRFDKRNVTLMQGESLTLALSVEDGYDANWNPIAVPFADAQITLDGADTNKTDAEGKITIDFDRVGTYVVSATGQYNGNEIFAPYCTVTVTNKLLTYVEKQQNGAAEFMKAGSYTVDNSIDFLKLIRSGYDVSAYKAAYINSVKSNLETNSGKLVSSYSGKEDLGLYGAVILTVKALGYPSKNFFGYDIDNAFNSADIAEARPHQYHYKYAIEAADSARAKAIIDDLIATYYTLGQGMDNYGYSCDNTAHFLISIAPYAADYAQYADDAKNLITACTNDAGAFFSNQFNTPNADSTALAMGAFASVGDIEGAFKYYKALTENYQCAKTGEFAYVGGAEGDAFATGDAMLSLYYFEKEAEKQNFEAPTHVLKTLPAVNATCTKTGLTQGKKCCLCNEVVTPQATVKMKNHTVVKDKAVAPTFKKAGKTAGTHCKVCGKVIKKQKKLAKLGAAKLSKVTKGKNKFTAKWAAVKGVGGYQIQYSLKKNMKKAKKKTVKGANKKTLTVKKLKSKKTYYVRIRAYKKIGNKVQYSKWSSVKKVKVK